MYVFMYVTFRTVKIHNLYMTRVKVKILYFGLIKFEFLDTLTMYEDKIRVMLQEEKCIRHDFLI